MLHILIETLQTIMRDEESGPIFLPICTQIDPGEYVYHKTVEACLNAFLGIEEYMPNV